MVPDAPNQIPPQAILDELQQLLKSPQFCNSPRLSGFLRYAVENTVAGKTDLVKESLIALEVYGRGSDYDPQVDSIVRVEASRLRAKLRDYYLTDGQSSALRMDLPRGSYVPLFRLAAEPKPPEPPAVPEMATTQTASAARKPVVPFPGGKSRHTIWLVTAIAVLFALVGTGWWYRNRLTRLSRSPEAITLAVLPFADLSEKKDLDYFCDGMAEELIDDLTRVRGVSVLARNSSFQFRGQTTPVPEIARRLRVNRLVSGSVRQTNGRFRINLQLVDAGTGYTLWSSSYDRPATDVLQVQEEMAREVSGALRLRMDSVDRGTQVAEAYDLYLKGRHAYEKSTREDERQAAVYFQQAIERDPNFAAAYAGLADALASLPLRGESVDPATMQRARDAAQRATELDKTLLEGLLAQAHIARTLDYDWKRAEGLYRQAVQVAPGSARPHNSFGVLLSLWGRFEEAQKELEEARRLDPLSMQVNTNVILNLYRMRRFREAAEAGKEAIQVDPSYRNAYSPFAAALAELGEIHAALAALNALEAKSGGQLAANHLALRGYILARSGRRSDALRVLAELEAAGRRGYTPRAALADVYLGLGDRQRALTLMEEGLRAREVLLAGLLVSPHADPVRSDPRFRALEQRVAVR